MKQIFSVLSFNLKMWRKNIKIIIPFILAFVCVLMLCQRLVGFIRENNYVVNIFEIFICIFNDQYSIVLTSILIIALLHDCPMLNQAVPYHLIRTDCKKWLTGHILYIAFVALVSIVFVTVSSIVSTVDIMYMADIWSNFAFSLSYSELSEIINIDKFRDTMSFGSPYHTVLRMMILIYLYYMTLSMIILNFNLQRGKRRGSLMGVVFTIAGVILSPATIAGLFNLSENNFYKANVVMSWISPLNHATYNMHNFGYDLRPRIWQSYIVFIFCLVFLILLAFRNIKKYEFDFSSRKE